RAPRSWARSPRCWHVGKVSPPMRAAPSTVSCRTDPPPGLPRSARLAMTGLTAVEPLLLLEHYSESLLEPLCKGSGALRAGRAAEAGQPGQAEHQREPLRPFAEGDRGHSRPAG